MFALNHQATRDYSGPDITPAKEQARYHLEHHTALLPPRNDLLDQEIAHHQTMALGYCPLEYQSELYLMDQFEQAYGGVRITQNWQAAFLTSLWVHPDYRGIGFGTELLAAAEQMAQELGSEMVVLETSTVHDIAFYLNRGYQVNATLDGYMPGHTYAQLVKRFVTGEYHEQK